MSIAATGEIRAFDLPRILDSLDQSISSLVDLLIEMIIFIREYLHHSFTGKAHHIDVSRFTYDELGRATGHFGYSTKIDDFEKRLGRMKVDFQIGMDVQTLGMGSKALKVGEEGLNMQRLQSQ